MILFTSHSTLPWTQPTPTNVYRERFWDAFGNENTTIHPIPHSLTLSKLGIGTDFPTGDVQNVAFGDSEGSVTIYDSGVLANNARRFLSMKGPRS